MYHQAKTLFVVSALTLGLGQAYAQDFIVTAPAGHYAGLVGEDDSNGVPSLVIQSPGQNNTINQATHTAAASVYDNFVGDYSEKQTVVNADGVSAVLTDPNHYHEGSYGSQGYVLDRTDVDGNKLSAYQDVNGITYSATDAQGEVGQAGYYRSGFFVGEVNTDGETLYAPELNADNATIAGKLDAETVLADIVSSDTILADIVSSDVSVTNLSLSDSVMTNQVYADGVTANKAAVGNVNADNVVTTNVVADKVITNETSAVEVKATRVTLSSDATEDNQAVRLGQLTTVIDNRLAQQVGQLPSNQTVTALDNKVGALNTTVLALGSSVEQLDAKLDRSVRNLEKEHSVAMAKQAALNGLFQPYSVGKTNVTAALGGYGSDTAVAVGAGYRLNEHLAGKAGVAFASGNKKTAYNVAVNYEF